MRTVLVALIVGVAASLVANMATTVYLHRALAHRALVVRAPAVHVFRFVVWVSTGIRPRQWVAVHRKHHAFTDVEGDPHSPVLHGWVKVQMLNLAMYRKEAKSPRTVERYARDLPPTTLDRVFYDHALFGLGIGVAAFVLVRVAGRTAGRFRACEPVPRRIRRRERDRPPLRTPAVRQQRRQSAVARVRHRRRGTAQQPSREADVGEAVAPLVRSRPRLVADQDVDVAAPRQAPRAYSASSRSCQLTRLSRNAST